MVKSIKNVSLTVKKDWQKRWMYDKETLWNLLKNMPLERQVKILTKVIEVMSDIHCSKDHALAKAFDCRHEDAGYYSREKKIRL